MRDISGMPGQKAGNKLREIREGRVVLLRDINAHSPQWNVHCRERRDTAGLKTLIEEYNLICNNKPGRAIRLTRGQITSIIDPTFTTSELSALDCWVIDKKLAT